MPVIGSSSVTPDFNAVGPSGPSGATVAGPIGNTGATGATGHTGATGVHVVSTSKEFPYLNLHLSVGSIVQIDGVAGITGATGAVHGVNLGGGITIFSTVGNGVTGATMWFRGITSDGSVSVYLSQDSNTIAISGDNSKQGGTADTLSTDRFLYLSSGGTASASGLTFESGGIMSFDNTVTLDPEENIITIGSVASFDDIVGITGGIVVEGGETAGDGKGIQLEVRHASVYKIYTPIGIGGFTGEFGSDEVFSFSAIVDGNHIWTFPSNIYFDEGDAYFSCAEDIVNFITTDGGSTWNASFSARGYGAEYGECDGIQTFGSCCYNDDNGSQQCIEYITQNSCQEDFNNGTWASQISCGENCGRTAEGICCSEGGEWGAFQDTGLCIQGSGVAECNYFGGSFWNYFYYDIEGELLVGEPEKIECTMTLPEGYDKLCAEPCIESLCCKDGVCIGDSIGSTIHGSVSPLICKRVFGGQVVENAVCGEVDCCNYSKMEGACCYPEISSCDVISAFDCTSSGGIFMGPDTECLNDICCFTDEIGLCCLDSNACDCCGSGRENSNCCKNLNSSMCQRIGGRWIGGKTCPESGNCQCGTSSLCVEPDEPTGACCIQGQYANQCINNQTQDNCVALLGGEYMGNNSTCSDELCGWSPDAGACCRGKDDCIIDTETSCKTQGYTWNGSPTCIGVECCEDDTIGGCCWQQTGHCGMNCLDLDICQCDELPGGVWNATKCTNNVSGGCVEEFGACCVTDNCLTVTCSECRDEHGGVWLGYDIDCSSNPCSIASNGACCNSGVCSMTTKPRCVGEGGDWQGDGSICWNTNCIVPEPTDGACCISETCFESGVYTEQECIDAGGIYQGDGVECVDVTCTTPSPTGACCWGNYKCSEITESECSGVSGTYDGDYTHCPAKNCTAPTGSCCTTDWQCLTEEIEADCLAIGGVWDEGTNLCVDCEEPTGSCCTADWQCLTDQFEADCSAGGGVWDEGTDLCVDCEEPTDPTGACCDYVSGWCGVITSADCNILNYFYAGDNTTCEDITCCSGGDIGLCCYYQNGVHYCEELQECVCDEYYGEWLGITDCSQCSTNDVGACCSATECYITTAQICLARGDEFKGINTLCGDGSICDDPTDVQGACCIINNPCIIFPPDECSLLNGVYAGDDTTCETNPCGRCCNPCGDGCTYSSSNSCGSGGIWSAGDCDMPCVAVTTSGACCPPAVPCSGIDLIFTVDVSGSMGALLPAAKEAINTLIQNFIDLNEVDKHLGLVSYSEHGYLNHSLDNNYEGLIVDVLALQSMSSTWMSKGLNEIILQFADGGPAQDFSHRAIIILSDGADANSELALQKASYLKSNGVTIYTIGLGDGADQGFLASIATPNLGSNIYYWFSPTSDDLALIYNQIYTGIFDAECAAECFVEQRCICEAMEGHTYLGDNTTCEVEGIFCGTPNDPLGACCHHFDCDIRSEGSCNATTGSVWMGEGTICADVLCTCNDSDIGACCNGIESCSMLTQCECWLVSETSYWNGVDTTCIDDICDTDPRGRCCRAVGAICETDIDAIDCTAPDVWHSINSCLGIECNQVYCCNWNCAGGDVTCDEFIQYNMECDAYVNECVDCTHDSCGIMACCHNTPAGPFCCDDLLFDECELFTSSFRHPTLSCAESWEAGWGCPSCGGPQPLVTNFEYLQLPDGRCEWIDCDINGCPYPACTNGT